MKLSSKSKFPAADSKSLPFGRFCDALWRMIQTPHATFADRLAVLTLRLLAMMNVLFAALFYGALLFAVSQAQAAETAACNGQNLLAEIEHDNPERLAAIRAEADAIPNGKGLLWRISKDGVTDSYLFGTMHMADPRVIDLPAAAQDAFDTASTVVIETTDILDQAAMMASMLKNPELMMFTDDTTLFSLVSDEDRVVIENALKSRGIPPASVVKMKPWMIASMVALPACELARKAAGAPVLDVELAQRAQVDGKLLEGLETVEDQLGAMASLPMDFHLRGLVETIKLGARIDDVIETMIVLYLDGDTGMFWPFFREVLPSESDRDGGYAAFEEAMVTARNHTMAARADPFLTQGGAFIAVGALHLPGDKGLVSLLRANGYIVEAVDNDVPIAGGDADEHGCRASAGYSWCARTAQCERPWELAAKHGFENDAVSFANFCSQ